MWITTLDIHGYLMKAISETEPLLYNFVIFSKDHFGRNIKIIRSDDGKEFIFNNVYDKFGILHQRTCVEPLNCC